MMSEDAFTTEWLLCWTCRDCGTQVPPPVPNGCPRCGSQNLDLEGITMEDA